MCDILLAGATGYIGSAVAKALVEKGYRVLCPVRGMPKAPLSGVIYQMCDLTDAVAVQQLAQRFSGIEAIISCIASRTGGRQDAWLVDYRANMTLLETAQEWAIERYILLSAICVQKPRLEFQHAKRAFEQKLQASGLTYSIVRPTAFFKSLAGQVEKVKAGKAFVMFDDGLQTACKPISEADLAAYICGCLNDIKRHNAILPIGGPGPAITPKEQAQLLFRLLQKPEKIRRVPSALFKVIGGVLAGPSLLSGRLANKREFVNIGHYYATESMLLWDPELSVYSAQNTPEFGDQSLEAFYRHALKTGLDGQDLGAHKLF